MNAPSGRREASHERIVAAAARDLRRKGYAGVGVAEVMAQAGLTHGGFYAHFDSREALLAAALERAGRDSAEAIAGRIAARQARGASAFRGLVEQYLSQAHFAAVESGCIVAALGSEMPRQDEALRAASRSRVRGLVQLVERCLPAGVAKAEAQVIAATLVGTLQLARTLGDAEGDALLAATRRSLLRHYDPPAASP